MNYSNSYSPHADSEKTSKKPYTVEQNIAAIQWHLRSTIPTIIEKGSDNMCGQLSFFVMSNEKLVASTEKLVVSTDKQTAVFQEFLKSINPS